MLLAFILCLLTQAVAPAESSAVLWVMKQPLIGLNFFWSSLNENTHRVSALLLHVDVTSFLLYSASFMFTLLFVYAFHFVFIKKLNRVRNLGDLGYVVEPYESNIDVCNFIQRCRKVGDVPPVFPNGWYGLIESHRIKNGDVKPVNALGLNLAVFRDQKGNVHTIDAYCPHMGANLAIGGLVTDDCLTCPFHGWQFRGSDGKCTKIPYLTNEKIPDVAKVKSYISQEINGWIYLWFDAEDREPYWQLPELEKITNRSWTYRGRTEHIINAHIEEIPENGADVAHLNTVHSPSILAGTDLRYVCNKWFSFNCQNWTAAWEPLPEPDGHIGLLKLTVNVTIWGISLPFLNLKVTARQIGPGVVYLEFESLFGTGCFIQSLLPVEPMKQRLVHNMYFDSAVPTFIPKIFMVAEAMQVERDIMIWNNKQFAMRPLLVKAKEDSLIGRHRRWFSQFYSEHSPRLRARKPDDLEW